MLPGFRIFFAAIVLSFSVLIFGLGAAALLRSAHEEFVGIPSWRAAQQPMMPAIDNSRPSLALLRVQPAEPKRARAAEPDFATSGEPTRVSVDRPATEKEIAADTRAAEVTTKPASKPRARRVKRTRSAKTIRHWRAPRTVQQPSVVNSNSPFAGFGASDPNASTSSGTGRNRRTATNTPF